MPRRRTRPTHATGSAERALPGRSTRVLIISNGHGEDSIAAEIVRRLPPALEIAAFPAIGAGRAYEGVCPVVGPRAYLASEGWRNVKGSLLRDIGTGGLTSIPPAVAFLSQARTRYDRFVVVGDMVGIIGCWLAGIGRAMHIDVYRTGYGRLYSAPERWLIGRVVETSFTRHPALAAALSGHGVDARCAGNVMMDTIGHGDYDAAARRQRRRAVTLLPGSRQWVGESFALQVEALRSLADDDRPDVFLALAGGVEPAELARESGMTYRPGSGREADDRGVLGDDALTVHVAQGALGNLLEASDLVLSQAGTATIQALGSGRPVITFITARDRPSRVRDESALFGEARRLVPHHAAALARATAGLLTDGGELARLGAIGRERIGPPGAMEAIVAAIAA